MGEKSNSGLYQIAQRYSEALFSIAEDDNNLDFIKDDLTNVLNAINEIKDFKNFLENPVVSIEDKKEVFESVFKNKIDDKILNFLKLLIDNNRFFAFPEIVSDFEDKLNKKRNIAIAQVISCVDIDNDTLQILKQKLEIIFKKSISLELKQDKSIIGGVVVKIADKIIDGSIKAKIEEMKRQLI